MESLQLGGWFSDDVPFQAAEFLLVRESGVVEDHTCEVFFPGYVCDGIAVERWFGHDGVFRVS